MNDRNSEVIMVPSRQLGLIIGKGGATIKEISQETGCRVNISKDEAVNDEVPVTLEGSDRNIEAAKNKINEITRRQHKRHQPDGGDNRYGNNDNDRTSGDNKRQSRRDDDDGRSYNNGSNGYNSYSNNSQNGYSRNNDNNDSWSRGKSNNNNDNDSWSRNRSNNDTDSYSHSRSNHGNDSYSHGNSNANDSWSRGRSNNDRQPVNDDQWGGWGKTTNEDVVDSLIFKDGDSLRGTTKFLPQSVDNYVPEDDWGIPSYIEDDKPSRKRPSNAQQKMRATKDKTLHQIHRNFYVEHPNVTAMSVEEKDKFLKEKNNIMIKEIDNDKDTFCNFGGSLEDDPEDNIELIPVPKIVPNPIRSFDEAFFRYPDILKEIKKQEFLEPSPIQCIGWPVLMCGRDLIGIAQTGTGKTLAFLLPAFIHIEGQIKQRENRVGPTVLILSPTRELAIQIQKEVQKYTYHDIDSVVCYGGADKREQINQLKENPEIVVGTPGRILDLKDSGILNLKDVSYLVLDEADRMLDMGFEIQVVNIIYSVRKQRQTVMTSATWPFSVQRIALNHMKDPVQVNVGTLDLNACHSVTQLVEMVDYHDKTSRLVEILSEITPEDKIIIFVARKAQCSDLAFELFLKRGKGELGPKGAVRACEIHGDLDQSERELALRLMRSGARNVMIATDVASRGLDIPDLTKVINFDFPKNIEEYVHRVGRTGRAGRTGLSITFMNKQDGSGAAELIKILQDADQEVPDFLPPLMKQYQEFRINGGRGKFGVPGRRGGGGYGRGGGGGRNSYGDRGDRGSNSFGGGGHRGDRGSDGFGRSNDCDDVKNDSSLMEVGPSQSKRASEVTNYGYNFDGSSDEDDWGNWSKNSPKLKRAEKVIESVKVFDIKPEIPMKLSEGRKEETVSMKHNLTPFILCNKDQTMYPICRNFYKEHPEIEKMNVDEVVSLLKLKNNIMIQELKTYPAQCNHNDDDDDDHFDEGKVELLPAMPGIPKPVSTFQEAFWQYPDILSIVESLHFKEPSPIQCIGWPTLLGGRDFIGIAQTGTGKTLTFVFPALVHIEGQMKDRKFRRGPTVLILSPTRELAMQIESEVLKIKYHEIKSVCCYGGSDKASQIAGLRDNPEIIVGTPGRINDLMDMGYLCLKDVSYLVLDEADRMLDMGFELQVVRIINCTRVQRQSVMTSATWPESVRLIALMYMNNPIQVNVGSLNLVACKDVLQELKQVENVKKTDALCEILTLMNKNDKVIVFVTRKVQCRSLSNMLDRMIRSDKLGAHANVCEIHGDLDQEERELSLAWFREGKCNILIATNVASRGLDISDVTCVVNYDFPKDIEEYVHRVGRTGRAGKQGRAVTFMNDMDWKHTSELRNILTQSKQVVPPWLMHLRAMKPSNIANYDASRSFDITNQSNIDVIKNRFSFNDDYDEDCDGGSFFDNFQSKCDPTFRASQGSAIIHKKKKGKVHCVEEKVVKYHAEFLDEVCDDLSDDYEDFFDEYQRKVDPTIKDNVEVEEVEEVEEDESWW